MKKKIENYTFDSKVRKIVFFCKECKVYFDNPKCKHRNILTITEEDKSM